MTRQLLRHVLAVIALQLGHQARASNAALHGLTNTGRTSLLDSSGLSEREGHSSKHDPGSGDAGSKPKAEPPWELQLAPYLTTAPRAGGPNNTTPPRGPQRLSGTFKGQWIKAVYGTALRPANALSVERGTIVLKLKPPEKDGRAPSAFGIQELQGELILRDGLRISDNDIRFKVSASYVPAAGAVHAILQPQVLAHVFREEVLTEGGPGREGEVEETVPRAGVAVGGRMGAESGGRRGGGGGGRVSDDGRGGWGYREALRTAARHLVVLGPSWYRTLLPRRKPPPSQSRHHHHTTTIHRSHLEAHAMTSSSASSAPPPPRPPLQLTLLKTCELRAHFQVYFKGDPEAQRHTQFLGFDEPSPPPPSPSSTSYFWSSRGVAKKERRPRSQTKSTQDGSPDGDGGGQFSSTKDTAMTAAAAATSQIQGGGGRSGAGGGGGGGGGAGNQGGSVGVGGHWRRLTSDTEIFHSTQEHLHGGGIGSSELMYGSISAAFGDEAASLYKVDDNGDVSGLGRQDDVYEMPTDMDPNDPDLQLVGMVSSPNCNLTLHFNASSVHLERYVRQASLYSGVTGIVVVWQIVLWRGPIVASSPSASSRMSLCCVMMQTLMDAYQCLIHATGALVVDALLAAFAPIAFLQFILFAVFEMHQTLAVWRGQRSAAGGGEERSLQQDMTAVYLRFYGVLLLGLMIMLQFHSLVPALLLVLYSWWVPQVWHSVATDTRPPMSVYYVWGMSMSRLLAPLYFCGCPRNLLRIKPRPGLCVVLVGWVGLQSAVLILQIKRGARAYIPQVFLPQRYDYHRPASKREMGLEELRPTPRLAAAAGAGQSAPSPSLTPSNAASAVSWLYGYRTVPRQIMAWFWRGVRTGWRMVPLSAGGGRRSDYDERSDGDMETGHASKECVICMNPVQLLPVSARMVTPCGHFFHETCLTRWMDIKMDCPTCRHPLPPV